MAGFQLPASVSTWVQQLAQSLDARNANRLSIVLLSVLFARAADGDQLASRRRRQKVSTLLLFFGQFGPTGRVGGRLAITSGAAHNRSG